MLLVASEEERVVKETTKLAISHVGFCELCKYCVEKYYPQKNSTTIWAEKILRNMLKG